VVIKYNTLSGEYSTLSTEYSTCMGTKESLSTKTQQETEELSNNYIIKRSELEKEMIEQVEITKKENKNKITKLLLGLTIFFFIITMGGSYLKHNWVISMFPTKIMGILTIIILVLVIIIEVMA